MKDKLKVIIPIVWLISTLFTFYVGYNFQSPQLDILQNDKAVYIAPYINNTHSCYNHAPGCQGELSNLLVSYTIDSGDQSVHIPSQATTEANGFFTLNLDAKKSYQIQMQMELDGLNYTGYTQFGTYADSPDCITTGQMHSQ